MIYSSFQNGVGGQLPGGLIAAKRMMKIPDVSVLGATRNALPELSETGGRLAKGFAAAQPFEPIATMICRFNVRTDQLHPSTDLSGPFCEAESSSLNHTTRPVARSLTIGLRVHRGSRRHCADVCCIICPIETASRRSSVLGQRWRSRTWRNRLREPCTDSSQENGTVKI